MSLHPLPPLILFQDFQGDWENYRQELYRIFLNTIVNKLTFLDLPISCRYFQPIGDMHRCFWHLISQGALNDEERIPDMQRCERIHWIAHIINNQYDTELKCWENKRKSNINTVLWLPTERYMIILSNRKEYYLLTTAYVHNDIKSKTNEREISISINPRKG